MIGQRSEHVRAVVVGELNVDVIVSGLDSLPVLGREILADECRTVLGSSSAICASGMAHLGMEVEYVGKLGADDRGRFVRRELEKLGIGTQRVVIDSNVATGITISLTFPADRALVTYMGSISALLYPEIDLSVLEGCRLLHVGSYYLQQDLQPQMPDLFAAAREAGVSVSLDPGDDPDERWRDGRLLSLLRQVDVFLPNEREACAIAGMDNVDDALGKLSELGPLVVIKRGPVGSMAKAQDGPIVRSQGFVVDAVDTTGAGDSFGAGFLYSRFARCLPLEESLRIGNACGAMSTLGVGGTGTQATPDRLEVFLREHPGE